MKWVGCRKNIQQGERSLRRLAGLRTAIGVTTIYGLLRRYIFSTDHKVIGLQYAVTSMVFLLVGFSLVILIRWQLAYPGAALPAWVAALLGPERAPSNILAPEFYNQLGAMHGTIMVFLGVVPMAFAAFGN